VKNIDDGHQPETPVSKREIESVVLLGRDTHVRLQLDVNAVRLDGEALTHSLGNAPITASDVQEFTNLGWRDPCDAVDDGPVTGDSRTMQEIRRAPPK